MKQQIVTKSVKYLFTQAEILEFGMQLAASHGEARNIEDELAKIKSQFKAQAEAVSGRVAVLSQKIAGGMEYRDAPCSVVYDAQKGRKYFFPVNGPEGQPAALEEAMTPSDYQQDLIIADSAFDDVAHLNVFEAGNDYGQIIVGKQGEKWYSAVRMQIGQSKIAEKMDSESPSSKKRSDAIARASKRALEWIANQLGKDAAEGFKGSFHEITRTNLELVEGGAK